jgi:hypothetical protein
MILAVYQILIYFFLANISPAKKKLQESGEEACLIGNNFSQAKKKKEKKIFLEEEEEEEEEGNGLRSVGFLHCIRGRHEREREREIRERDAIICSFADSCK